ncbi:MAG: L-glutamate gamma-semialdehyde dehydrogenase, partial [Acidobacteria bacterium]
MALSSVQEANVPQLAEFRNQALTDFSSEQNRRAMEQALAKVRAELGREYDLIIGGERIRSDRKLKSYNPSKPTEVVGVFQKATEPLVQKAVAQAEAAYETWRQKAAEERVSLLLRLSQIMQERRLELAAWMIFEVGKSWTEADADVAEAIDFCEFYAREALRLGRPQEVTPVAGEENNLYYIPLGVGVIIPPWNFPLAILTGMTTAAVVTGNTVIVKPSSDAPAIAARLIEMVEQAGFPPGVVNFLTGSGAEVGDVLVTHPRVRFIAFTGSKEVGLRINELAAKVPPGQIWIKRAILEMGGKDAIIVDSETNLDEAAAGVVASAFGFQGQKCSACSRAIVVEPVYDAFLDKLKLTVERTIKEGNVEDAGVNFGPVVNQRACQSILEYIEIGRKEGRVIAGGNRGSGEGYVIRPTVIADVDSKARIAQEEIFGPVLAVIKARDYKQALEIANDTQYGLTGAVYTDDQDKLAEAERKFHVGNLYLNRKCTGALVGAHPFGGFNMSGTDSKAGGKDYLLLFTQAKAISRMVR